MDKLLLSILISLFSMATVCHGQKVYLCLTDTVNDKALLFEKGDYVYIGYDGYLGQSEGQAGYIVQLDTAGLVLGKTLMARAEQKRIAKTDITGIRRLSAGLELAKAITVLAVSLGTYSLAGSAGAGRYGSLTASVAAALSVQVAGNAVFPAKRPKYFTKDGWTVSILVI